MVPTGVTGGARLGWVGKEMDTFELARFETLVTTTGPLMAVPATYWPTEMEEPLDVGLTMPVKGRKPVVDP